MFGEVSVIIALDVAVYVGVVVTDVVVSVFRRRSNNLKCYYSAL